MAKERLDYGTEISERVTEAELAGLLEQEKKERVEITIRINSTEGRTLKEILKEVWELREEHPDILIYVEVYR